MPRSSSLRAGRFSQNGQVYLLTAVTLDRARPFHDWRTGRLLVDELRAVHLEGLVTSKAWVLMPDHLHWLVELNGLTLEQLMRRVKSRSAYTVNQHLGRSGRLWQKNFHDRAIRREQDLKSVARYIIANPLRAGLVARIGDYPLWDAEWI